MTGTLRLATLLTAAALLPLPGCRGGKSEAPAAANETPSAPGIPAEAQPPQEGENGAQAPLDSVTVTIYFPSATGDALVSESREIFATTSPGDRAKQILSDLIAGPTTDDALPALPAGTRLRQVYVLGDGTAYADFSLDLLAASGGGSTDELLSVYAIVDSIAMNVPGIARVGILVEGRPCETLAGHLDLRNPLRPDPTLIEEPPIEDAPPGTEFPPLEAPPESAGGKPIEA